MEKTLVILKPCTLQRGLVGEITNRFERKGLRLAGMKMIQLTDEILNQHYAHLSAKPFFQRVKDSMMVTPVIVCCYEGVDAVQTVRAMAGVTIRRLADGGSGGASAPVGSCSHEVHTSDSVGNTAGELTRLFNNEKSLPAIGPPGCGGR